MRLLDSKCLYFARTLFPPFLNHISSPIFGQDCVGGRECYFSHDPQIYEHMRNIMGCWFLHTDRSKLPALIFDPGWYNVAIHVRPETVLSLSRPRPMFSFNHVPLLLHS